MPGRDRLDSETSLQNPHLIGRRRGSERDDRILQIQFFKRLQVATGQYDNQRRVASGSKCLSQMLEDRGRALVEPLNVVEIKNNAAILQQGM